QAEREGCHPRRPGRGGLAADRRGTHPSHCGQYFSPGRGPKSPCADVGKRPCRQNSIGSLKTLCVGGGLRAKRPPFLERINLTRGEGPARLSPIRRKLWPSRNVRSEEHTSELQ